MSVSVTKNADHTFLLTGILTAETVGELWAQRRSLFNGEPSFRVDLKGVTHCDSSGLALLTAWARYAKQQGKQVNFIHLPSQLLAIAHASGLENILPIENHS
jgi:phospholipid transport system transporter-binding protein